MSKKIGIVGFPVAGGFGVPLSYMAFFSKFGDVEIISHTEKQARTHLDLLVLPGGPDVDTTRYLNDNESINLNTGKPCIFRERFDRELLPAYIDNNTPIFGVCRGHQSLAVYFGGTLIQDMYHEQNPTDNRAKLVHETLINMRNSMDFYPYEKGKEIVNNLKDGENIIIYTNSIHHQVVDTIPDFGKVVAVYNSSKTSKNKFSTRHIEAISYTEKYPAITVQWHPEEIEDHFSVTAINYLLNI